MSFGDVTSANVVGFQNKEIPTDGWRLACNTFLGVGKEKSAMTLGDFVPNANWDFSTGDSIQFLSPSGGTASFVAEDKKTYKAVFSFLPQDMAESVGATAGWYQADELQQQNLISGATYPIEYGDGFVVVTHNKNTTLNYSGEVLRGAQNLEPVTSGWNLMGNALPIDTTLSELTPNALWDFSTGDAIQFLSPSGGTASFVAEDKKTYKAVFSFLPKDMAESVGATAGWYQADELQEQNLISGAKYPLAAGDAFVIEIHTAGTKLQLPAAIAE